MILNITYIRRCNNSKFCTLNKRIFTKKKVSTDLNIEVEKSCQNFKKPFSKTSKTSQQRNHLNIKI